jgi:hypothetical protein
MARLHEFGWDLLELSNLETRRFFYLSAAAWNIWMHRIRLQFAVDLLGGPILCSLS